MTYTIERVGHRGDGIAKGPVFVPMTLPGEVVEGEPAGDRLLAPKIVTPSLERVKAPCPHFRSCGACAMQHASDTFVAGWKIAIVEAALAARGLLAPVRGIATSPPLSRRRAALAGRRTKTASVVGFHARSSDTIIPIPQCRVLVPEIVEVIPFLETLTKAYASRKGEMSFAVNHTDAGIDVAVTGAKSLDGPARGHLAQEAQSHDIARLSWDGETIVERRPPLLTMGTAQVSPPPGAFLQATAHGEAALVSSVREALGECDHVLDLFAGCGTFTLPLAARAEVHAVETDGDMLGALDRGWRQSEGLKRVTTEQRDLFRRPLLVDELKHFDGAVIDPPRAGALAQTAEIARSTIGRIAAVSCDPSTFARDAELLTASGYRLEWIDVVDQFRWSPHVELVAGFTRSAA